MSQWQYGWVEPNAGSGKVDLVKCPGVGIMPE